MVLPVGRVAVVRAATPVLSSCTTVVVPAAVKLTDPVGTPPPAVGTTVAVNVTSCPLRDGLGPVTRVVAVAYFVNVWVAVPALGANTVSPL